MRFEDVDKRGEGDSVALALAISEEFECERILFKKPYTFVEVSVVANGVRFEGVGFARQRQYTSLLFYREGTWLGFLPRICVVLAHKNEWDPEVGEAIAGLRAIRDLVLNVKGVYKRWKKGHVVLPIHGEVTDVKETQEAAGPVGDMRGAPAQAS